MVISLHNIRMNKIAIMSRIEHVAKLAKFQCCTCHNITNAIEANSICDLEDNCDVGDIILVCPNCETPLMFCLN